MPVETLLHLEKGQSVRPFEGKNAFLPVDLVELLDVIHSPHFPKSEPLLRTDVEFDWIGGQVVVSASSRIGTDDRAETPLGPVTSEIVHYNGIVGVRQVPLHLRLDFWLRSMEDWQKLLDNRAVFSLGIKRYPVQYHLETLGVTEEKFQQGLRDLKILPANGSLVLPETYNPARVLLPFNVARLAEGINLTMG